MVSEALVQGLAESAGTTWNPEQGLVIVTIFDCDQRPLTGVSLLDNRAASPYYFTGTPSLNTSETDAQGQAGFINMEVGSGGAPLLHKLTIVYQGQNLFSVSVAPRPRVLKWLDVEMTDYGTTADRATTVGP